MSRKYNLLITSILILLVFIFFSFVLFNKSENKKVDTKYNEGRVIDKNNQIYNYLKDDKKNIVHFWATWCSACAQEHEFLKEYIKKNKDVNLISVLFKDDISNVDFKNIKELYQFNINDSNGFIALDFGVSGVPESFILDNKGKVLKHIIGSINNGELK